MRASLLNLNPVVVTGIGVVTAAGIGNDAFQSNLRNGVTGIAPAILQRETGPLPVVAACVKEDELPKYIEPRRHLNFKHMSRSGVMVCAAAALATKDGYYQPHQDTLERTGIVMGTAFGGIQSMLRFNADVRAKGPTAANPIIFPDTVSNAPAGYAAIAFGTQGMNATLSTGFSSGLRALRVAYEQVASGVLDAALAGGYDELIPELCHYWQSGGSASNALVDGVATSRPFDSSRSGFYPGDGAVVLLLERAETAARRGASIYGAIRGFGSCQSNHSGESNSSVEACTMRRALRNAGVEASEVSAVFASANGSPKADRDEAAAISGLFDPQTFVAAIKSFTGECMAAAGPASVAAALLTLRAGVVPGIPRLHHVEPDCPIRVSDSFSQLANCTYCLVNSFGLDSQGESLILGL